ncbi:MAG: hypothetical protein P8P36_11440 [Akkermansiaceae bacterium]|nr:hypothetical protein [Akkermansiaceae bacterium]
MKNKLITISATAITIASSALAGPMSVELEPAAAAPTKNAFENARRPISNPTLFDLAVPRTALHAIYMHHKFPSKINTTAGKLDMGGDLNLYALGFEYAINERFSIIGLKDGYVDFNPDNTFTAEEGFANIAAGVKYAFIYSPESQYAMSGSAILELPLGDEEIFQGEGDGSINLSLQSLKLVDQWQFSSSFGCQIPFDSSFSTNAWVSAHVSYELNRWFIPLLEVNYFRVLDNGDGASRYPDQAGGAVAEVAEFEGADLLNWGAANSDGADYATLALGFRSRLTGQLDLGVAYELPLTNEEDNITESRLTIDLFYTF